MIQPYLEGIPKSQKALVAVRPGVLTLMPNASVPDVNLDEILVRIVAVALNPSDWKLLDMSFTPGAIAGGDFSGIVVKVGQAIRKQICVGDRVCGNVFGSNPSCPGNGAFSQYISVPGDLCMKIPESMSFQDAASLGMGVITVGLSLKSLGACQSLDGELPSTSKTKPYALVYGASTATGTLAIQLFRHHGYAPIAVCSPHNFSLVRGLGAVDTFDYHSPTCREDIRHRTDDKLGTVLDCITSSKSMSICYGAIGRDGGQYVGLESFPVRWRMRRRNVKAEWILGWTAFGKTVELGGDYYRDAAPEDREFAGKWFNQVEQLIEAGKLKPHPIRVHRGGIQDIISGLEALRRREISGFKSVFLFD
ncbi:chaperonin 10-like protein [Tricladium varicosporioides]|nr:chaperonin 10-like protein [Hymenoscyphus varicosporioides]